MFTTHPVKKSVVTAIETVERKNELEPISLNDLSNFISFFFDKKTNSVVLRSKVNLILQSSENVVVLSEKDIVILTGNGLDEKTDGEFRVNPSTPTRKY